MARLLQNSQLLSAQSAGNTVAAVDQDALAKTENARFYAVFGAGTSAGAVVVEGAHDPAFTGTWDILATLTWAVASSVKSTNVVGAHRAVRVRISTAIVGGTVDVYGILNG